MKEYLKTFNEKFDKKDFIEAKIDTIKVGDKVTITGTALFKKGTNSKGSPYLLFMIKNNSGMVSQFLNKDMPIYDFVKDNVSNDTKVEIQFVVEKAEKKYRNVLIENISVVNIVSDMKIPTEEELKTELKKQIKKVKNLFLRDLISEMLRDETIANNLFVAPATEKTAYNYKGGVAHLLIDTMEFAEKFSSMINLALLGCVEVDSDLLITGAFACNIGRVLTLEIVDGKIQKTLKGQLETDVICSREITGKAVENLLAKEDESGNKYYDISIDKVEELLHMVSSSKAKLEYGSMAIPRSKHAIWLSDINSIVYTKGLFENLENTQENLVNEKFTRAYDNSKVYYIGYHKFD